MIDPATLPSSERTRCEVWSRVMGYHRPVASWNAGKQGEYRDRIPYRMPSGESLRGNVP
jgi:anaerobic ribonucleoside-triphosphate reductase